MTNNPTQECADPERLAAQARAKRRAVCEQELTALLEKHRCGLQTIQQVINGQPGPVQLVVVAK